MLPILLDHPFHCVGGPIVVKFCSLCENGGVTIDLDILGLLFSFWGGLVVV